MARLSADVAEAARVARGEAGRLDLAFLSSAASSVSVALGVFTRDRPDVHVRLHEGFTNATLHLLERAVADVGIVRDADERSGISLVSLLDDPFVAVMAATHPLAGRAAVTAGQLVAFPLISFPARAGARAHSLNTQPFHEASLEPEIAFEGSEWNTILHLVAAGLGVTIAPRSVVRPLPEGATTTALADTAVRSTVQLATRTDDDRPLVRQFRGTVLNPRLSGSSSASTG